MKTATTKALRRTVSVLVVVSVATLAAAGDHDSLIGVNPRTVGIKQFLGSGSSVAVMVQNQSATAFTGKIVYNCGAPPAMRLAGGTGDPFSIAGQSSLPVLVECPATLPVGMHRCTFDIQNSASASVASFDGFCATFTQELLTATPIPVQFANQQVGVESQPFLVAVSNPTGTSVDPMSLQVDNPNFLIGSPCQNQVGCDAGLLLAGNTAQINLLCKPLTSGIHLGKLFLVGSNGLALPPVDLSCATGAGSVGPILTISPPNVTLQPIEVNDASSNTTVELRNGGTTGSLTISSISLVDNGIVGAANDWSFTVDGPCMTAQSCVLGPDQRLDTRLTFDPSGFNNRPAKLIINYTDPMGSKQASVTLDGAGIGATTELVSTPSVEFGVVPLGVLSSTQTFKLRNQGNRSTTVMLSAAPTAPFLFPMMVPLPTGETTLAVTCMSNTVVDASVTLAVDGPDANATLAVPMHCEVRDTLVTTNPTSIALAEVRVGASVPDQIVLIDRVGAGSPIPLTSALLTTTPDQHLSLGALGALQTPATSTLSIAPTAEGPIANSILVTPMTGQPLAVPVTGSVVRAELAADAVMTLGTFCVGQPTSATAVSLTSTGTATIVVEEVELTGGAGSPFTLERSTPTTYPASLASGGGKATLLVTPKRTEVADDDVQDMLVWSTDAGPVTSMLTTRFVADGGAVAPDSLDFGDAEIRLVNDDAQGVTLQNCSTDPLQLIQPTVPPPFALTGEFPLLLEPAARATFSIVFLPTEVGPVEKDLTIESMGGDRFAVTLHGNGITGSGSGSGGDDDDGSLDDTSFYACGCQSHGEPSGVLVIALAVLYGARRRRR